MILHIFFGTKRNADSTSRFLESAALSGCYISELNWEFCYRHQIHFKMY